MLTQSVTLGWQVYSIARLDHSIEYSSFLVGMIVMRPAAAGIWDIARKLPQEPNEAARNALMADMGKLRARTVLGARVVFGLLVLAVALMAIARYVQ